MIKDSDTHDAFAEIASQVVTYRSNDLLEPSPQVLNEGELPLHFDRKDNPIKVIQHLQTPEQLDEELFSMRSKYERFMQKLSPEIVKTRSKRFIETFDWRIATDVDKAKFLDVLGGAGEWEKVKVPHYGGPLGRETTYYRTTFNVSKEDLARGAAFICFKGVDYIARVFINGAFLGEHEGFFAPFEFDFTEVAVEGENTLLVQVDNDFVMNSNVPWGDNRSGDKIYAATNLGYDDHEHGWHHCPPGMGIYQDVFVEFRQRTFISDIYVRPLPEEGKAELWFEASRCDTDALDAHFEVSVYGRNFDQIVVEKQKYHPTVIHECGKGDDLQIARAKAAGTYQKPTPLKVGPGANLFKVTIEMGDFKWWSPETPWLYQIQISAFSEDEKLLDSSESHFGMRSFKMDEESSPKGKLYLNGQPIRLRGANTMGHEQQCVFKKNWDQLRDDILLAKICNMNFLRLTQRPVQPEVYDYCDMLGLMTQCDLPTFAVMRHTQFCEALRQVEEMERLARPHPCNIIVSYINEPVTNSGNEPHRHLSRDELEDFFVAANKIVRKLNPERVLKPCDGDYDPPAPGIQDRHCYCTWYNGQGVDIGKLHKGYWQPTKANWVYGCGEFGAEGLECKDLMNRRYPDHYLLQKGEDEKNWSPNRIKCAQTGRFHYFFFETPESIDEWVEKSQQYQASALRMMAEAFRRDNNMVTFAVHLFIDAFPSGWMKTIMDCERRPKLGYFAYRDALSPLLPNLRTDRTRYFSGEQISVEAWVCNDLNEVEEGIDLCYQFSFEGDIIASGKNPAKIESVAAKLQGSLSVPAPETQNRKWVKVVLALVNKEGKTLNDTTLELEIFPSREESIQNRASLLSENDEYAQSLLNEMKVVLEDDADVIFADHYQSFIANEGNVLERVNNGSRLVILNLDPGSYQFGEHTVKVKASGFNALHFASRRTGHTLVDGFQANDFLHWYHPQNGCITPIVENTFTCDTASPILLSGNTDDEGEWTSALASAELKHGKGSIIVCQVALTGRTTTNPPAYQFVKNLLS